MKSRNPATLFRATSAETPRKLTHPFNQSCCQPPSQRAPNLVQSKGLSEVTVFRMLHAGNCTNEVATGDRSLMSNYQREGINNLFLLLIHTQSQFLRPMTTRPNEEYLSPENPHAMEEQEQLLKSQLTSTVLKGYEFSATYTSSTLLRKANWSEEQGTSLT